MTYKSKLFAVFFVLFIGMISLLSYSIYTIQHLKGAINQIVNEQYQKVEYTTTIRNEVNALAKSLRNYLLSGTAPLGQQYLAAVGQAQEKGAVALLALDKMTHDENGVILIKELKTAATEYLIFQQNVIKIIKEGRTVEAGDLLTNDGQKYQQTLFDLVEHLVSINKLAMDRAVDQSSSLYRESLIILGCSAFLFFLLGAILTYMVTRQLSSGLSKVSKVMQNFSSGNGVDGTRLAVTSQDEIGVVSHAFNQMADALEAQGAREKQWSNQLAESAWLHENMAKLFTSIQEIDDIQTAVENTLREIMPQLNASLGVIYVVAEDSIHNEAYLERVASYPAYESRQRERVRLGEGLVGQCGYDKRMIEMTEPPAGYFIIESGLGSAEPRHIVILPLLVGGTLEGVLELASLHKFSVIQMEFIVQMSTLLAIHINKIKDKNQISSLLVQSQRVSKDLQEQSDELLLQQDILAQVNAELEEHTAALEESENQLQIQQADLESINEELREKSLKLEESNQLYQLQNQELEQTTKDLEQKTVDLMEAISYKAIFLANMSHELRTPLNSLLILAKHLADNKDSNLTAKQVEYALTIYSSGRDLLVLINEILDLAKVESRKVEVIRDRIELQEVLGFVYRSFEPIAQQQAIQFYCNNEEGLPSYIYSDKQKLLQILQNLLSNAFKFTEQGSVRFSIGLNSVVSYPGIKSDLPIIEFTVTDSGIGIEQDKQDVVFEAFVQADGTTSRKYGGTGLGLSISKELAALLGGEIQLKSKIGEGSTFTLLLPVEIPAGLGALEAAASSEPEVEIIHEPQIQMQTKPIRNKLDNRTLLLVDDDIRNVFALSS
ncbi:MAG: histidine kinase, partial [Paenibacillus sp.]|nr:histidine kinase [Paenibacillus sp.]